MIDVKQPVRKSYYDLLNGALSFGGNPVPVVDDVKQLGDASMIYVIMANQTGADASTFQTFDSEETIILDIVYKAGARASKEVVDNIAGQIFGLVLPAPGVTGLVSGPGVQINCVKKSDDRYLPLTLNSSNSVVRRLLTFTQHVRQTGSSGVPPPFIAFRNPIRSVDFTSPTSYLNPTLKGRTFLLFLNDNPAFLEEGVAWQSDPMGGFEILIPNFDATLNNVIIYLLLT